MSTALNPGYGYRILDTSTEPPMEGDEFYFEGVWRASVGHRFDKFCSHSVRLIDTPYRRKIDVGAGYELVPETEMETGEMEYTLDGVSWVSNYASTGGRACVEYFAGVWPIRAFRRKIQTPRESFVVIKDALVKFYSAESEAVTMARNLCKSHGTRYRVAKITRSFSPETTVTVKETTP